VLGLLYAPSFAALLSSETYGGATYWPLWALPWLLILGGIATCATGAQTRPPCKQPDFNEPSAMPAH